jgi:TP901 family phage tail tape measure protein
MSEFVAGAFVDVRPEAKGFRADLRKQLDASVRNMSIKIPVELDPKRFKSTVANAARGTSAKVPIEPSTSVADLRKAIQTKITSATTGMKIKVPIEIVQTGAGSRGGTGATAAATQGAGSAVAAKTTATAATKKLTVAEQQQVAVNKALQKSNEQLAISARLFASAAEQGITVEEQSTRLREARNASSRAAKVVNDQLAISDKTLTATQRTALETKLKDATTTRVLTTEKQKQISIANAEATATRLSAKAQAEAVAVMGKEITTITKLNTLHLIENDLLASEAALRAQTNRARELGLAAVVKSNEGTQQEITRRKELIALQRAEIKGEGARTRAQKTAARGGFSTALSLLGVRGATLAANNAFLIGAAGAAVFAKSLASFAQFEQELNVFQVTAGATAEQMREVQQVAHDLGADLSLPGVTAADAAQSMSELARAGLSVRDSIAATRGVLELAAAAQISNAEAANITASALNAFSLEGEEASRVADLLANAANASQGSITEMAAAMQQALTIANLVGFSLQDTVATLSLFARNGLKGSDAGTSLRTALSRLIAPTRVASQLIDQLGLNLRDAQGNLRSDVFVQFGEATKDLSPALRDMIAQTIAGQDAIRAFAIGADEGRRGLERARLQMAATGTAALVAGARAKGLGGQFRALGSQVETLGVQLGKFASGPVSQTVRALGEFVGILNNLATGNFQGIFDQFEKDAEQFVENMKRHGAGLVKVFNPGSSFNEFRTGLKEVFTPAAAKDNKITQLQEALARLQNLRIQAFDIGADIGPITEQIKRIRSQLKAEKIDAGLIIPVTDLEKALAPLEAAKKEAQDLRREILDSGGDTGDTSFLDQLLHNIDVRIKLTKDNAKRQVRDMKKGLADEASGTEIADSFGKQFDLIAANVDLATPEVLSSLNDLARRIKGVAPITGSAGKEVGTRLMASLNAAIRNAVKEDNPEVAQALKALAAKIAALFGVELGAAFKNIKVPLTAEELEEALLPQTIREAKAEAFGGVASQIAAKEATLESLNKQLLQVVKGTEEEEKILNAIAAKKNEIRSLREGQASDEKQANSESDKKVEDSLSAAERKITNKLALARETETLKDDIARQVELRNFYVKQIETIKATVKDANTRRDKVAEAEQNLFEVEKDIRGDRRKRREQIQDLAVEKLDERAERAGETETLKDDVREANRKVRFWKRQVEITKDLVRQRKATAGELKTAQDTLDAAEDDARAARRSRREQRRDELREGFELDIGFAQTTENASAELKARQRFIKFLEDQKKFFKGNKNKLKELRNEIAEQKKAIQEVNDESKKGGTTAFELLSEAAATFRANAGNLVGGDQPFAGPAGFTADMAQFLRRQARTATTATPLPTAKAPTSDSLSRNDQAHFGRLSNALENLTKTIEREPGTGKTKARKKNDATDRNDRHHFDVATSSRQVVERRSGV